MNTTTLHTKIGSTTVAVTLEVSSIMDQCINLIANTEHDALVGAFCYKGQRSKIENTTDGRFMLVVYNTGL